MGKWDASNQQKDWRKRERSNRHRAITCKKTMPLGTLQRRVQRPALVWFGLALALATTNQSALAVQQPGGKIIPVLDDTVTTCTDKNVQICIDDSEGTPGLIDAVADALIQPETFKPTCLLTFKPLVKGGTNPLAFGWYNVKPDPANAGQYIAPTQEEVFGMLVIGNGYRNGADLTGQSVTLDLNEELAAGRYTDGEIGFFLATANPDSTLAIDPETHELTGTITQLYVTQHDLNFHWPNQPPFYTVLTWQSVAIPNAFYFGWEDLPGNDDDFDDLAFLVGGIQCSGGGEPCDTGGVGACAVGTMQCQKGALTCIQNAPSTAETCNAVDDDCNGDVDEGDLCDSDKVCDRGVCVPKCGGGEFRNCPLVGFVCDRGLCIEEECAEKDCPAGEVCQGGECVDACSGISCPHGRVCHNGGCVDACAGVTCDNGFTCVDGVCQSCECSLCGAGQVCQENLCIESACENMTCDAGTHCSEGTCVADCDGAVCPNGQICEGSDCVPDPNAVGGSEGGAPSGVPDGIDDLGTGGTPDKGVDLGNTERATRPFSEAGCLCAVPAAPGRSVAGPLALLLTALTLRARAKKRSATTKSRPPRAVRA
jgi:hypothetical protein